MIPLVCFRFLKNALRRDRLNRLQKLLNVLESFIDASKTDVSNNVDFLQMLHHNFAQLPAGNLADSPGHQLRFNFAGQRTHLIVANQSVPAGGINPVDEFFLLEVLISGISFFHLEAYIHGLKRSKSFHALTAFAAAADCVNFNRIARISHFRFFMITKWAFHTI
jgi:hypothetical protein